MPTQWVKRPISSDPACFPPVFSSLKTRISSLFLYASGGLKPLFYVAFPFVGRRFSLENVSFLSSF